MRNSPERRSQIDEEFRKVNLPRCTKNPEHSELNLIFTDSKCRTTQQFLDPVCAVCIEENNARCPMNHHHQT
jgi:hypothetical protein